MIIDRERQISDKFDRLRDEFEASLDDTGRLTDTAWFIQRLIEATEAAILIAADGKS